MAAPAPSFPAVPKSIVRDLATLNLDDAFTRHQKLWEAYGHELTDFAVNLLVAAVILVITFWAAGWGAGLTKRAIGRLHSRNGGADVTLQSFLGSLTRYAI